MKGTFRLSLKIINREKSTFLFFLGEVYIEYCNQDEMPGKRNEERVEKNCINAH